MTHHTPTPESTCENCGKPAEYDSTLCLCGECERASDQFDTAARAVPQHTPLPWEYDPELPTQIWAQTAEGGDPKPLADCFDWWPEGEPEANAALIVLAVNSHEALLEALKELLEASEAAESGQRDESEMIETMGNARTAIAAATPTPRT